VLVGLIGLMTAAASPAMAEDGANDAQFSSLFSTWVKMNNGGADDNASQHASIPSREPVESIDRLSSNFGSRSDPFNGHRRMHQGIDIPGPLGTPVYATADGVVELAEYNSGGYGNLVEINHGNGMQTRYGHLSRLVAQPNEFVRRGQLIGLMGSTGRSTGSHLHYEVRIDGSAVNPLPYIEGTNFELALAGKPQDALDDLDDVAMGGPEARKSSDNGDDDSPARIVKKKVVKKSAARQPTHHKGKSRRR
jgi:murein DD-endopeptidase MepM/ murein hydrolase activator NlpD